MRATLTVLTQITDAETQCELSQADDDSQHVTVNQAESEFKIIDDKTQD